MLSQRGTSILHNQGGYGILGLVGTGKLEIKLAVSFGTHQDARMGQT
jgi:hypothetical protein